VDTSIHRGNSGGPIIDIHGKVIGIASGVAMDWIAGPIPLRTLLPDMGMVLPIDKAVIFLRELKAGQVKWNGVLDLSVDAKVNKILDLAEQRQWSEAQLLADRELQTSFDPTLVLAAAMIHFCAGNHRQAGRLFESALSMDDKNIQARLLLYLIDWLADRAPTSAYRRGLLNLDWRSPHEFFGYLVRVLEGSIPADSAIKGGTTDEERNWLRYIKALAANGSDPATRAEELLQPVVLTTGRENWLHFLALSRLQGIRQRKLTAMNNPQTRRRYQEDIDQFEQKLLASREELAERQRILAPLQVQAGQEALAPDLKRQLLEQILAIDAGNGDVLVELVFYYAMNEDWARALVSARRYLSLNGRENEGRLRMGLLAAEILAKMDRRQEALAELENYFAQTADPWYRRIADCLLDPQKENSLAEKAGESPEYLLTGHVALAFWAEGKGDKTKAIDNYREALGSYMDDMIEYGFAAERIKMLRNKR
jgi:tetratricopeptide (TPR) repeat protein